MTDLKKKFDLKIIVVDLLKYKNNYLKQLKSCLELPIVSFHEHYDFSKFSDLSINYNIFENLNNLSGEIKLLGYKYIIFNDLIDKYKFKSPRNYIFVSFGGSDYSKLILNFIKYVVLKLPKQNFVIHTGVFSKNIFLKRQKNLKIINHKDSFFKWLGESKRAVVAGGNMMYEAIYLKKNPIILAHNNHQEIFAKIAQNKKLVDFVGRVDKINFKIIKTKLYRNLSNLSKKHQKLIDNKGKGRILEEIEKIL